MAPINVSHMSHKMGNESKIAKSDPQVTRSGIWIELDPHMDRDSAWQHAKTIANKHQEIVYMTQSGYCSMIVRPEQNREDWNG